MANSSPLKSHAPATPYWHKHQALDLADLEWNIPYQPTGSLTLVGGNSQNFSSIVKIGEFLASAYPLKDLRLLLPDVLSSKLPRDSRFIFAPSTPSGSFAKSSLLATTIQESDLALVLGNLTKNPVTRDALVEGGRFESAESGALASDPQSREADSNDIFDGHCGAEADFAVSGDPQSRRGPSDEARDDGPEERPESAKSASARTAPHPLILTRDSIDLLASPLITHPRLILIASLAQLQKLFRALYYPKVLLLSMPIYPVVDALHKFTLSYPTEILTFHDGQIILARAGEIHTLPLAATDYTPLSLWQGQLAARYAALTLYNPSGGVLTNPC